MDLAALMKNVTAAKKSFVRNERAATPAIGENKIVLMQGWRPEQREMFFREFASHFIKDATGKTVGFYPCDEVIFKKACPVCAALAEAARQTNDQDTLDLIKKARANTQYLINAIIIGKNDNKPQVMALSKTCFEQLLNVIGSWGQKVFDPANPQVVNITRTGTGFDTKYMVSISPETYPLPADILSQLKNLDDYVNQRSETLARKAINAISAVSGSIQTIEAQPVMIASQPVQAIAAQPVQPQMMQAVPQPMAQPVMQAAQPSMQMAQPSMQMAYEDLPTTGAPDPLQPAQWAQPVAPQPAPQPAMPMAQPAPQMAQPAPTMSQTMVGGMPPSLQEAPKISADLDALLGSLNS